MKKNIPINAVVYHGGNISVKQLERIIDLLPKDFCGDIVINGDIQPNDPSQCQTQFLNIGKDISIWANNIYLLDDLYTKGSLYIKSTISAKDITVEQDCCAGYIYCYYAEVMGDIDTSVVHAEYGYKSHGEEKVPVLFIEEALD